MTPCEFGLGEQIKTNDDNPLLNTYFQLVFFYNERLDKIFFQILFEYSRHHDRIKPYHTGYNLSTCCGHFTETFMSNVTTAPPL